MDFLFSFSSPSITATLVVIFTLVVSKFCASRFSWKGKRYPPVAGTCLNQLINFHRLLEFMTDLANIHRTYRLLSLFRSEVYTSDPANVEYILKTNFANYGKGRYHYNILKDLMGDGIFTVDGKKWQYQRKMASHEFSTTMLRDFSTGVFHDNAVKLAGIVSQAANSNEAIEIQDLFMKSTLDSVFKIILGIELDSTCGTYEEGTKFYHAFDEASSVVMYRYVDIFWQLKRFLNIGSEAVLKNSIKVVDDFVYKVIESKRKQPHKSKEDFAPKKRDILSRFLEMGETDSKKLKDIILCFIIAGKDTTAITLSWFLYMLCKHPHIQEKIAQEVREVAELNLKQSVDEQAVKVTEKMLERMHYVHAALTETLRLYPAVPVEGKFCFADDTWPDGYSVKNGDLVSFQPYVMGRMKFIWGEDAEEFRPERWLDEKGFFRPESPFKFTAFQAGPRICLGKDFAYCQMKIFSAILVGNYVFKLNDENKGVTYRTTLTLQIDGGLHLQAVPRKVQ